MKSILKCLEEVYRLFKKQFYIHKSPKLIIIKKENLATFEKRQFRYSFLFKICL